MTNVTDLAGNPIAPGTTAPIIEPGPAPQIVITEIMQNPNALSDAEGEWFEVYNAGTGPVDMNGWLIRDVDLDDHVIANGGPLVINPGEYKVFGINAAAMAGEGVTVFYQYAGIALGNGADELILETPAAVVVDSVAWDDGLTFPDPIGKSMQWDGNGDNADGANWADTGPVFGSGDRGTPGLPNDVVSPAPLPGAVTALAQNHPNPFNPNTLLSFSVATPGRVTLRIYDLRGRLVRALLDEHLEAGVYNGVHRWDGLDDRGQAVTSGTYFCRLETADGQALSRKMTLLR